jgi:aminopeptidase N
VRSRIGDQAFFAALRTYLTAHRYGVAHADDLIQAFDSASPKKIDDLYNFWILDKK